MPGGTFVFGVRGALGTRQIKGDGFHIYSSIASVPPHFNISNLSSSSTFPIPSSIVPSRLFLVLCRLATMSANPTADLDQTPVQNPFVCTCLPHAYHCARLGDPKL
jgi:hypothetical protein